MNKKIRNIIRKKNKSKIVSLTAYSKRELGEVGVLQRAAKEIIKSII